MSLFSILMNHRTSPREAGRVFSQAKPKLAAYTHFVFLATEKVPAASVDDIIKQTREIYEGPLEAGEDLMSSEIGDTVTVTGTSRSTSQTPEYPRGAPGYNFYATMTLVAGTIFRSLFSPQPAPPPQPPCGNALKPACTLQSPSPEGWQPRDQGEQDDCCQSRASRSSPTPAAPSRCAQRNACPQSDQ
jgi:hypothetical protein